jgi:hypothetical protein
VELSCFPNAFYYFVISLALIFIYCRDKTIVTRLIRLEISHSNYLNFVEQNRWEANSHSASQETSHFYRSRNFITMFTRGRHWFLSWARLTQSISVRSLITLSRENSVGVALGHGLDDRGSRVLFRVGAENFSLRHRVQNVSGAHPASYPMGNRGSFPGDKAAGAWSWPFTSI